MPSEVNGAESHGPSTPQDPATSPVNPSSHGITARTLILQNENQDRFVEMLSAYFDLFLPANQMEIDIVSDIVAARWRLRRMWRYQTAILDIEADNQAVEFEKRYQIYDEDIRGAAAFSAVADNSKGYATALRHDIHLTRTYRKAIDDLRRLRGGNILPKIPVLQNEPKVPGLKSFGYNKNVRWRFPQNPKSPWRQDHDPCRKQSRDRQGAVFLGGAGGFACLARSRAFLSQLLRARFAGGAKLAVARKETNRCIDGCRLHPDPIY